MKKALLLLVVLAMCLSLLPISQSNAQESEPIVKVKLVNYLGNKTEISLKPNGDYLTSDENVVLKANETYTLKQVSGKLSLYKNGTLLGSYQTFSVKPNSPTSQLSINNRPYLGSFDFIVENSYVRPINSVYMEDYLKGVVPIEMYPSWNVEALKTQAVAARTYATSYLNRGIINDTISYQVYGGYVWTPNTTKAVDETKGEVLHYNGRLIDAVYSSSNGGMTESNANAWGNTQVPYLTIKEDNYDPKFVWNYSFNKTQIDLTKLDLSKSSTWWASTKEADPLIASNIKAWLNNNGYANKDIKITAIPTFALSNPGSGGRVKNGTITVEFLVKDLVDTTGKLVPQRVSYSNVNSSRIRAMIGNRVMLSYLVDEVKTDSNIVQVTGRGDGHGVGMSQWGAQKMAENGGKTYAEILKFYYTGISIVKVYEPSIKTSSPSPMEPIKQPIGEIGSGTDVDDNVDRTVPIISEISSSYDASKKVTLTYAINETVNTSIYIKDSNGVILQYFMKKLEQAPGKYVVPWDVSSIGNGTYTFGIITTDLAGNVSSAIHKYTLNIPKDEKAPAITNIGTTYKNSKKNVTLSYTMDEAAMVSVYVKNAKGAIVKQIENNTEKSIGKQTALWNVSNIANGSYTLLVVAEDVAGNKSTRTHNFSVAKRYVGKINGSNVFIRQKASTNSTSLGKLQTDNTVLILNKTGSWYYIQYGQKKGYVYAKYINIIR
ncbi:SpoIID/LytB domain protein [Ureibacillus xyleni]|uniref:SpoIID/LytB domain protein n=1 Tax=Ureibacillus xyleni TaxID=614648 RepID=A0A285TLF2_9BACL|nr:SpoIID/LytB domain-containing protein [Ureibacillus xyleni]SOC23525.1 SpoIID/LytB domain protein [Ureibacillus xyleni]